VANGELACIYLGDRLLRVTRRDWEAFMARYKATAVRRRLAQ